MQRRIGLCCRSETCQGGGLGLSKSKPDTSSVAVDNASRCHEGQLRRHNEDEKQLYQQIVAKHNYLAHDRLDLKYATSCLASAASAPSLGGSQAAKRVGRYLRKALVAWQGFPFRVPGPGFLLCYTDAHWVSDRTFRRSTSGGVVPLGGGVLNCWAKKQRSVALLSWVSELFSRITSGTRSLGDPKRVGRSRVQLQCHRRHGQPERHRPLATSGSQCCVETCWSERSVAARSSCRQEAGVGEGAHRGEPRANAHTHSHRPNAHSPTHKNSELGVRDERTGMLAGKEWTFMTNSETLHRILNMHIRTIT